MSADTLKKSLERELYHPIDMAIYEASRYQIPSTAVLLTAPIEALRVMEESTRKNDRVIALDSSHSTPTARSKKDASPSTT